MAPTKAEVPSAPEIHGTVNLEDTQETPPADWELNRKRSGRTLSVRLAPHLDCNTTGIASVVGYGIRPLEESGQAVLGGAIRENGRCEQEGGDEGRTEEHTSERECYLWMVKRLTGESKAAVESVRQPRQFIRCAGDYAVCIYNAKNSLTA